MKEDSSFKSSWLDNIRVNARHNIVFSVSCAMHIWLFLEKRMKEFEVGTDVLQRKE
jgi:hypothetical protein